MNKYLLFGYRMYYPSGGMLDYIGAYDTIEEAQAAFRAKEGLDFGEIAQMTETGLVIVEELERKYGGVL